MTTANVQAVQSVNRALDLLQHVAEAGGTLGLSQLATVSGLPLSTVHRITRSLVAGGYLRQESNRQYSLGLRLVPLGDAASRTLGSWTSTQLERLVTVTGETANAATLDGDSVLFVAQVPSRFSMRTSTEVGRRVLPHCSGVGKALLSMLAPEEARAVLGRVGTPALTANTLSSPDAVMAELQRVRELGYAIDDEEEESGARCVAVPVWGTPVRLAISVSGPSSRVTHEKVPSLAAELRLAAEELCTLAAGGVDG
jgi:IclR family acetate operon transcriptional repressor